MQQTSTQSSICYLRFLQNKIEQLEQSSTHCEWSLLDEENDGDAPQRWAQLQMQREQLRVLRKLEARERANYEGRD